MDNNFNGSQQPGYGQSIASMVCGICSIVASCFIYGIAGVILGVVALVLYNMTKSLTAGNVNGMAKAGMICGIIGTALGVVSVVLSIVGCIIGSTLGLMFW